MSDKAVIIRDLQREAERLEGQANELSQQAKKLRDAIAVLSDNSPKRNPLERDGSFRRPSLLELLPIKQRVQEAIRGKFRTVREICDETGLDRKQVTHALHARNTRYKRRVRASEGRPEFCFE